MRSVAVWLLAWFLVAVGGTAAPAKASAPGTKWGHLNRAEALLAEAKEQLARGDFGAYNRAVRRAQAHLAGATVRLHSEAAARESTHLKKLARARLDKNRRLVTEFPEVRKAAEFASFQNVQGCGWVYYKKAEYWDALVRGRQCFEMLQRMLAELKKAVPADLDMDKDEREAPEPAPGAPAVAVAGPERPADGEVVGAKTDQAPDVGE